MEAKDLMMIVVGVEKEVEKYKRMGFGEMEKSKGLYIFFQWW